MEEFAQLMDRLEDAKSAEEKLEAIADYLGRADPADAAWSLKLLIEKPLKKQVGPKLLKQAAFEAAGLPEWLFEQSIKAASDLAEAASLIVGSPGSRSVRGEGIADWMQQTVLPIASMTFDRQTESMIGAWSKLTASGRYYFNRLVLGLLKPAVSAEQAVQALSIHSGIPVWALHLRLSDPWEPTSEFFSWLISSDLSDVEAHRPYRLCQAVEAGPDLGDEPIHAEWKWAGFRAQAIRRAGMTSLWTKSEFLISHHFPEIVASLASLMNGTVLDGVVVAEDGDNPGPASAVVSRMEGKLRSRKGEAGMVFIAFDILESDGEDVRSLPFRERRNLLERIRDGAAAPLLFPVDIPGSTSISDSLFISRPLEGLDLLNHLEHATLNGAEGLILKRHDACYGSCETEDSWLVLSSKLKTLTGVLMYVERGQSGQIEQITVGVWGEGELVPIAKVPAALSPTEVAELEAFVKENTIERFGPVRTVRPAIVIDIAYTAIEPAPRRKSGIVLNSARIVAVRKDIDVEQVTTLKSVSDPFPSLENNKLPFLLPSLTEAASLGRARLAHLSEADALCGRVMREVRSASDQRRSRTGEERPRPGRTTHVPA